ncbi:DUF4190 domain-containing protein [Nocardia xishanensis]|uniref:DUF4190 domain-containing protein n=1 Tax=Nocardia xishanensis TaxID=238964 RepID=UPI0034055441
MTNPGDSDEWWKQYGGQGVSPDSGAQGSVPQYPASEPTGYPSAPQYPQQQPPPSQPQYPQQSQYPNYQQPAAGSPYQSGPAPYPQQPNYGYPQGYQPYGAPQGGGSNGLAIAAMIVSIAGVASCCFLLPSIIGLVLGVVALNQMKQSGNYEGKGMAQAGVWVGVGGIVLGILYWVLNIIGIVAGV